VTVHPKHLHRLATTSHDNTTRLYDLSLPSTFPLHDAAWPDGTPFRGGPPLCGLVPAEDGGEGKRGEGRCIGILRGGIEEGGGAHNAVMSAVSVSFRGTFTIASASYA
jgi:hypothetical protein